MPCRKEQWYFRHLLKPWWAFRVTVNYERSAEQLAWWFLHALLENRLACAGICTGRFICACVACVFVDVVLCVPVRACTKAVHWAVGAQGCQGRGREVRHGGLQVPGLLLERGTRWEAAWPCICLACVRILAIAFAPSYHLTTAPLPSLPTPNALQSSCNLTKQAHAVKSKKSLNIIHIGNICKFPHKRTHDLRTHCKLENMGKRLNAHAHTAQSFHLHTLHTVASRC